MVINMSMKNWKKLSKISNVLYRWKNGDTMLYIYDSKKTGMFEVSVFSIRKKHLSKDWTSDQILSKEFVSDDDAILFAMKYMDKNN